MPISSTRHGQKLCISCKLRDPVSDAMSSIPTLSVCLYCYLHHCRHWPSYKLHLHWSMSSCQWFITVTAIVIWLIGLRLRKYTDCVGKPLYLNFHASNILCCISYFYAIYAEERISLDISMLTQYCILAQMPSRVSACFHYMLLILIPIFVTTRKYLTHRCRTQFIEYKNNIEGENYWKWQNISIAILYTRQKF